MLIPTIVPTFVPDTNTPCRTPSDGKSRVLLGFSAISGWFRTVSDRYLVPLAGIEPALLAESDFESDASTSSAIGATRPRPERHHVNNRLRRASMEGATPDVDNE